MVVTKGWRNIQIAWNLLRPNMGGLLADHLRVTTAVSCSERVRCCKTVVRLLVRLGDEDGCSRSCRDDCLSRACSSIWRA